MSATTSAFFWLTLLNLVLCVSGEPTTITAEPGKNATLPCKALNNEPVIVLEWRRTDTKTDKYVLLYRDDQFDPAHQHPSFKNRRDLQDRQMKDGDVTLIVKNVTTDDSGTYECRIQTKTKRRKRSFLDSDPICIIRLDVLPGQTEERGDKEGLSRGHIGLIVVAAVVVLVAVVGFLIFRRRRHPGPYHPPPGPGPQQF